MKKLKNILRIYTEDLNYKEIEKLLRSDFPDLYKFYAERMEKPEKSRNRFVDLLLFSRNLFLEFLKQLSPVRRIIYSAAVFFFFIAFLYSDWQLAVLTFIALNILIAFELADKLTVKDELELAREIQLSLMPQTPPEIKKFEVSSHLQTANMVGGDYYDFFCNGNGQDETIMIIGDISGKGMAAAIHMVQVQSILHNIIPGHESPGQILKELNASFSKFLKPGSFFTAIVSTSDNSGKLTIARAGHVPLLWYSTSEDKCMEVIPKGIGIGLGKNDIFDATIEESEITPSPGDVILMFTDGLTETIDNSGQLYGTERIKTLICHQKHRSPDQLKSIILKDIDFFRGDAPVNDDLTFIILKAV